MVLRLAFSIALGVAVLGEPALAARQRPLFDPRVLAAAARPPGPDLALFETASGARAVLLTSLFGFLIFGRKRVLARIASNAGARPRESSFGFDFFDSENAAHAFRPNGTVVWLNMRTGVFHERGARWYGRTRDGAYVSLADAASFVVGGRLPQRSRGTSAGYRHPGVASS